MTSTTPIRLIAIDIDGTLLNPQSELTPRVEKAIRGALAQGIQIVLATGKSRNAALPFIDKLGIPSAGIFLQGLALMDAQGKVLHQQTLDPALLRRVLTILEDRGFEAILYSGMRILVRQRSPATDAVLIPFHEPAPEAVGPLQNYVGALPIQKLLIVGEPQAITGLRWHLGHVVGGAGRLMQAGWPNMLELLPPGASKGAMLARLLADLKIAPAAVLAIGDAENDIEMIQMAGVGVAMANAAAPVKAAANWVTASNSEHGVALALEKYIPGLAPQPEPEPDGATVVMQAVRPAASTEENA
jgi:Cof subfamily protein (haloacid dehalogenase superfamily)